MEAFCSKQVVSLNWCFDNLKIWSVKINLDKLLQYCKLHEPSSAEKYFYWCLQDTCVIYPSFLCESKIW